MTDDAGHKLAIAQYFYLCAPSDMVHTLQGGRAWSVYTVNVCLLLWFIPVRSAMIKCAYKRTGCLSRPLLSKSSCKGISSILISKEIGAAFDVFYQLDQTNCFNGPIKKPVIFAGYECYNVTLRAVGDFFSKSLLC